LAGLAFAGGAASAVAHRIAAPSVNIKQARSPGIFPEAALNGNLVTGLSLCMKNTALAALIAPLEDNFTSDSDTDRDIFLSELPDLHQICWALLSGSCALCGASLLAVKITVLSWCPAVMSITHHKRNSFSFNFLSTGDMACQGPKFPVRPEWTLLCF